MRKTCSGGITVFLSVVFPFALLFFVCLFWYGRQSAMKNSIRNDVDAAGFSVLSEYEKDWVNEYGLYVIPQNQIESDMKFYMEINSAHSWGDYQIDELTITQTKSLQDPAELQEQIMMFMNERGWLELIEEIGSLVLQIKDLDQQVDEEINWKESDELLLIQELYGELVTLFEGIRNDGKREPYSINFLLDDEPTLEEVKKVLDEEKLTSEQVGVLEQAYDELDQVAVLCGEAIMISEELEKAIDELETNEELPVTTGQLQDYRLILHENQALCEEASKAIYNWVAVLEEEEKPEEIRERAILCTQALQEYDRSIQLPYEYRESDDSWDFSSILSSLKGYPFDIGDIAPDEELDLQLQETESEEEFDLDSIEISESFEDQFLITEYVLGMYQNFREAAAATNGEISRNLRGDEKKSRFFNNEIEYLLIGKSNEYKNVNGTKNYIIALRCVLNMVHLLADSEKRAEIEVLAGAIGGILLPGIGNGIFFGIILTIWSWGEAIVDYQVLVEGGEVPLLKTKESWRTDIASILSLNVPDAEEKPGSGMDYEQYLRLMLYTVDQEKLLTRIQNLLCLNHQSQSLAEAVTHFVVEGVASDGMTEFSFSGEYEYGSYDE